MQGPHQVALKSITTSFPSFDAFIMMLSTSANDAGSKTSPPFSFNATSRQLCEVEDCTDDFVGEPPRHTFLSGRKEFPRTNWKLDRNRYTRRLNCMLDNKERLLYDSPKLYDNMKSLMLTLIDGLIIDMYHCTGTTGTISTN